MSEVLQQHQCGNPLSHVVKADHKLYYIDSCLTPDAGYETMVFPMADTYLFDTEHTIPFNDYVDWGDIYYEHYVTHDEMEKRHKYICEHLEEYLDVDLKEEINGKA